MKGYTASTYGDRIADVYDEIHRPTDVSDCVDVLARIASGGRTLELGIGTGTFALPLADRGVEIHGIESSYEMVDRLRAKNGGGVDAGGDRGFR